MLREVLRTQQKSDEPRRRWFFSHEMDLLMWFDDAGEPVGFQLSYGKYHDEHALRWKAGRGFSHHRVDDGESSFTSRSTPILIADGAFEAHKVLGRFQDLSLEMPPDLVQFVAGKLAEHPEYAHRDAGSDSA